MTAKDLKNALLQEAVQGKLVPQIASEGNARDLLEEIQKEKAKLIKEGKLKKEKPLPEISEDEIPFDIPDNWCWCRLGEIFETTSGTTPQSKNPIYYNNGTIGWVRTTDLNNGILSSAEVKITEKAKSDCNLKMIPSNSVCIALYGGAGTIGKNALLNFETTINQSVCAMLPNNFADMRYLQYFLQWQRPYWMDYASGSRKDPNINQIIVKNCTFPLPPLAEQKRIVAAIEKFMPLIEEYGKKQTELKVLNEQIGTLTKKAILQEAVQGKLVPQISAEGNAKDLLEEIRKERLSHGFANSYGICDGKNKKSKSSDLRSKSQISVTKKELPEITEDEIPFDIPENWCWCRWGDLSESIQYGYNAPAKETGRIKMVRISDIHENKVFWDSVPYCDISEDEIQTYILKKNDILFARTGGTVGKSFLVQDVPCEAIYAGYLIRTHYNSEKLVPQYLKFFMESNLYWEQLKDGTIATAQPNCNGKTLSKMLIPLPPLAEQKRIVAAIEKMLPLCEKLGE